MNYHDYFPQPEKAVETCLLGAGAFGRSYVAQTVRTPGLSVRVAVDIDAETAASCLRAGGIPAHRIALCQTVGESREAWASGKHIATDDFEAVATLPLDVVIEATGHPEAGARHCLKAIESGRHVVLVSKEVDSVIGPYLCALARQNCKVLTPVDGDQPSLLIGLVTWAERLGFNVLAAGKASEYDFVVDLAQETVSSNGKATHTPGLQSVWQPSALSGEDLVARRAACCGAFSQHLVPDLCEMQIVANATGLTVDRADFHAPIAHIMELADIFAPRSEGGILSATGTLDVFHCFRRSDEVSAAGGVFVVVACEDRTTWQLLADKGHLVSSDGRRAVIFLPRHLLGLEAATSVLEAAIHGRSTGAQTPRPRFDLLARAESALTAGSTLSMGGHHHTTDGASAELHPAKPLAPESPVPYYLAANCRLVRDIPAGAMIRLADIDASANSTLLALRRKQDAMFFA